VRPGETASDATVMFSQGAGFDFTSLAEKAAELREVLVEKGWTDLAL
jgi:hypothetical protein